ncbi:MAG TPA: OmpA family protein [Chitinivibrionales bacterium]|nr:OmpA family protein [Chitinivibrionales bacterium]
MRGHGALVFASVTAAIFLSAVSCSKKVTKLTVEKPVVAEKPAPAPPPFDSTSFKEARLQGELEQQAREALQNIYFDFDKSTIKPEGETRLTIIGKFMADHPAMRILIAGNCDERGSAEYNIGLGQKRAQNAKNFLVTYGVASDRIELTSYGKERPAVAGCTDEECHAKNRRDEFSVLEGTAKSISQAQ